MLGAGDAFMSGFLRGWLRDEPLETCCAYANASGAFAVSRLLCSAEYPTWAELSRFLQHGSPHRALRHDETLEPYSLGDDAPPAAADDYGAGDRPSGAARGDRRRRRARRASASARFKLLAVEAAAKVAAGRPGFGMLLDGKYGREALFRAADHDFWIGRPVEEPGSRPLDFEFGGSLGAKLIEWPLAPYDQVPVLLSSRRSAGDEAAAGARTCCACMTRRARIGRELLIEIIAEQERPGPRRHDRARPRAALCASASSPTGGSSKARRPRRRGTRSRASIEANDPSAAASCCSGSRRRRRTLRRPSRIARQLRPGQRLRGRPDDLRRAGAGMVRRADRRRGRRSSGWRRFRAPVRAVARAAGRAETRDARGQRSRRGGRGGRHRAASCARRLAALRLRGAGVQASRDAGLADAGPEIRRRSMCFITPAR